MNYENGTIKNIHYGDVLIKFGEILDIRTGTLPFISREDFAIGKVSLLQNGDIIFADAAEDETVGKCSEIKGLDGENVVSGLHTIPSRPVIKFAPGYLGYYLNSSAYHNQLLPLIQGTKISSISKSALQDTSILYPIAYDEQQQIGNYFSNIDNLITLHQRKLKLLNQLKQGYLQQMFPPNDEKVPQLRFANFSGEWGQRKLGELMDVTSVKRIHQSDWTDSGIRFLRARDVVSASKNEEPTNYLYISEEKYNDYAKISGKVSQGDLLVTGVGSIGVPLLITDDNPLYFKDGNIIWFKNDHKIEGDFFYYSFINNKIQKHIRDVAGIGTVGTYTIDSGKKTPISLPSYDEQAKIGSFFKSLDTTITLHQKKLDSLKQIKTAYLKSMFI